jgi:hypothetical protein
VVPVKHFPAGSCASSTVDFPHPLDSVTVYGRVERGDEYVREHGIERIDMLKIDVEGAEMRVLQGLEETISAGRVRAIQFEYSRLNIVARCFLRDLYEFLVARGYRVGKIYPTYVDFRDYSFDHEDFIGPNYLAIRR